MDKIPYIPDHPESFEKEWGIHRKCREWWYATGVLFDEEENMYSYQYTLMHVYFGFITAKIVMLALTDYKNNRHYYFQCPAKKLTISKNEASFGKKASVIKRKEHMDIHLSHKNFTLDLKAGYGKGAFWHCNNGKLQMGLPGKKETTLYYSYTNMPTEGTLILNGIPHTLKGKSWFDKQGGTYSLYNPKTHWEWFSLRFFDDEEVMLFTFPQNGKLYQDGTYITEDGRSIRLNKYTITRTGTVTCAGMYWSSGWKLTLPIKEKEYEITPVQYGHMNFAYFEQLCAIKNHAGDMVGYAFAELLPGVLNGKNTKAPDDSGAKIRLANLFKRVEI